MKKSPKTPSLSKRSISEVQLNVILIIALFILALVYFAPFLSGARMMYGSDWLIAGYPIREWISSYIATYHSIPLWNPYVFGGMPTVAASSGDALSIYAYLRILFPTHLVWSYTFVLGIFLAGLGVYLFLRELGLSLWPSFTGGLGYMFAGNLISTTYGGHEGRMVAAALFPFALLFLHKGLIRPRLPYFVFAGGIAGLSILHGHFQLTYYGLWAAGAYLVAQLVWQWDRNHKKETLKLVLFSLLGLAVMVGLIAASFLPVYESLGYGARGEARGYEYATSWALPPFELLDLLTPHFSGLLDRYWGENYFKLHTEYIGILPLILTGIAVAYRRKDKYVKFFLGLAVVAVLVALGGHTPFYRIFYYLVPLVKKFRGPAMAFYLVAFSLSVLGGIGLQGILESKSEGFKRLARGLFLFTAALTIFLLFCIVGRESFLSGLKSYFQPLLISKYGLGLTQQKMSHLVDNYPYFLRGLGKAFFLAAVYGGVLWALARRRLKAHIGTVLLVCLVLFDLWPVGKQFLRSAPPPAQYYAPDEVVRFLHQDNGLYRVFPLYYEHATDGFLLHHRVQSVGGYESNPPGRYQEFIGAGKSVMFRAPNLFHQNFLDLLNVRYIISVRFPQDLSRYDEGTRRIIHQLRRFFARPNFEPVFQGRRWVIYENKTHFPRAFLVSSYEVIPEEHQVLVRLKDPTFDPRQQILLEESPGIPPLSGSPNPGITRFLSYDANEMVVKAKLTEPGFLVLSENYHPGWKAYVDGLETKVYQANYTFRAIYLSPGEHEVKFFFRSRAFEVGKWITISTLIILLGCLVWEIKRCRAP